MGFLQQFMMASAFKPTNVLGLKAWYQVDPNTNPASVADRSGNGNTLTTGGTAPALTANGSVNVLRWDGTTSTPLVHSGDQNYTHVFITACLTDATFSGYQGLIGGATAGGLLVGDGSGGSSQFFDLGYGGAYVYSKNGTVSSPGNAPVSGVLAVLQATLVGGFTMTGGIEIGSDRAFGSGRYWKGDVANCLIYDNGAITAAEALQCRQWCALNAGGIVVI